MKRRMGAAALLAALVAPPLANAFACSALASLSLSDASAMPLATVTGLGKGFANSHGGAASPEPVVLHWNARTGPEVWSGRPDASGAIAFSFTVPRSPAGTYAVIATQLNADGSPVPGTPATAALEVLETPPTTITMVEPTTTTAPALPAPSDPAPVAAPAPAAPTTTTAAPTTTTAPQAAPPPAAETTVPAPAAPVVLAARREPVPSTGGGVPPALLVALGLAVAGAAGAGGWVARRRTGRR